MRLGNVEAFAQATVYVPVVQLLVALIVDMKLSKTSRSNLAMLGSDRSREPGSPSVVHAPTPKVTLKAVDKD